MKEKTYRKMTQKRPFRRLRLFKQEYLTKQRFFALLAKMKLVREVIDFSTLSYNSNDKLNRVVLSDDILKTDRGEFNFSFYAQCTVCNQYWWYESLFKKKKLHTVSEEKRYNVSVKARSECLAFLVKIDPFNEAYVTAKNPIINFCRHEEQDIFKPPIHMCSHTIEKKVCNFLNARFALESMLYVEKEEEIDSAIYELVKATRRHIYEYIKGNPEMVNERITGVKYDGDFCTKDGFRLLENVLCPRCGKPVFKSGTKDYTGQCLFCDEDFYSVELVKVDPVRYRKVLEFNKIPLQEILSE